MKLISLLSILLISVQSFNCDHGRSSRLNFFDIELLRYACEGKSGNIMVSPASVKTTLAMLMEGAKGVTANEIRNALRLSLNREDRMMELIGYLNALQVTATLTKLSNANGIFVSKTLALNKAYEATVKRDFSAELSRTDFSDPKIAADHINRWVSDKTRGLIPTIVEPAQLTPAPELILANALYFKSSWMFSFDPLHTHADCFYRGDDCRKVAMMELETNLRYSYVDDLRAHALELPYVGKRYSMFIIVPIDREGCEALIRDLPFISLTQISSMMHITEVLLSFPKFKVDYSGDLVDPLKKMNINSLFSTWSNLTGIFDGNTASVSSFQHKVFMSVDEEGTEAAAVSSAAVVPLSFSGVDVKVDRPFVFFIRDNDLDIILFEGKIEEPTAFVEPPQVSKPLSVEKPVVPNVAKATPPTIRQKNEDFITFMTTTGKPKSFLDNLKSVFG